MEFSIYSNRNVFVMLNGSELHRHVFVMKPNNLLISEPILIKKKFLQTAQYTIKGILFSNTVKLQSLDGSFAVAESNSFLSPWEILLIALENKYLGIF